MKAVLDGRGQEVIDLAKEIQREPAALIVQKTSKQSVSGLALIVSARPCP